MSTKERIQAVIDTVPENRLDDLYAVVCDFVEHSDGKNGQGIMERLKNVKIEAPADFAANLDQYVTGEKSVPDHLR